MLRGVSRQILDRWHARGSGDGNRTRRVATEQRERAITNGARVKRRQ